MKAIETEYHGILFRSRNEARWAMFFDLMGIEWRYEDEGYELSSGRYLPDFVLLECGTFIEVRGDLGRVDLTDLALKAAELPVLPIKPAAANQKIERGPQLMLLGPVPADVLVRGDYGWLCCDRGGHWSRYGFGLWHKNTRPWWLSVDPNLSNPLTPVVDINERSDAMSSYAQARAYRWWSAPAATHRAKRSVVTSDGCLVEGWTGPAAMARAMLCKTDATSDDPTRPF